MECGGSTRRPILPQKGAEGAKKDAASGSYFSAVPLNQPLILFAHFALFCGQ
jgi:hypothetical protein